MSDEEAEDLATWRAAGAKVKEILEQYYSGASMPSKTVVDMIAKVMLPVCTVCHGYSEQQWCKHCNATGIEPSARPPSAYRGILKAPSAGVEEIAREIRRIKLAFGAWDSRNGALEKLALAVEALPAQAPLVKLYYELLYAVVRKREGESRHETALRYIREAETHTGGPVQATGTGEKPKLLPKSWLDEGVPPNAVKPDEEIPPAAGHGNGYL